MNAVFSPRQQQEFESARKLYEELNWRLAFLKEKGPEQEKEPSEQEILNWYREIPQSSPLFPTAPIRRDAESINRHFQELFPIHTKQYGPACLETGLADSHGQIHRHPLMINHDFMAACLSDSRLGLEVIYYESDMQFYFASSFDPVFKPVSPEKLACLYRGLILRTAELFKITNARLNVWAEFRSDKNCRLIIQRAKAILSVSSEFFSPTSPHQRIKGQEILERVARRFVSEMLTGEPGEVLKLADAYSVFHNLVKQRGLGDVKRSDFKAVVVPLIREQFDCALRNDLPADGLSGVRGWKNIKMIQTAPSLN